MSQNNKLNWSELGFSYIKTDFRYLSKWKDGAWDDGQLVKDNQLTISEGSTALHYGQQCFEGLKAYKTREVHRGFADCIYLDPQTHSKIEEVGAANFFGVTRDDKFVTPRSESILPSITKYSLMHVAKHYLSMEVEERDVWIDKLDEFKEAGACGTAAVITPIGGIEYKGKLHVFYDEKTVGPVTKKLYDTLCGIQFGEIDPPEDWIVEVE